jgi:L-iditol 2-dehydrogenase
VLATMLLEPRRLELAEVERPVPGPGEVVVRVRAALTCGTDLKAFLRGHPKWPMPTRFGHEAAGEIYTTGEEVTGFSPGDGVMLAPTAPCGSCFWCSRAQENLCESLMREMVLGTYAEYVKLPERVVRTNLYRKPEHLSYAEAALLEPLACVVFGLSAVDLRADDRVVILGAGAIALLHVGVLRQRGLEDITVVARSPARAAVATAVGAARIVQGDATRVETVIRAATSGMGADVVIECTGRPEVWETAPRLARRGGQVVLFGGCAAGSTVSFDTGMLHYDQVRVTSPFHFTPPAVREAAELLARRVLPLQPLLTDTLPLAGVEEALRRLEHGQGIKYVIEP